MEKMTFNDKLKIMCDIFKKNHKKLYWNMNLCLLKTS